MAVSIIYNVSSGGGGDTLDEFLDNIDEVRIEPSDPYLDESDLTDDPFVDDYDEDFSEGTVSVNIV